MAILKVIELLASSNKSWEQATAMQLKKLQKQLRIYALYM